MGEICVVEPEWVLTVLSVANTGCSHRAKTRIYKAWVEWEHGL